MKRCPTCSRTYTDDALSFCLDDGAPLLSVGGDAPSSFDPNATLAYPTPRETSPQPQSYPPPPPSQSFPPPQTPTWSPGPTAAPYPQAARKKSALPWILGGAAVLLVLGIGFVVLIAILAAIGANSNSNRTTTTNTGRPSGSNTRTSTAPGTGSTLVVRDDFSSEKWPSDNNENKYEDGEFHMHASTGNYIVVLGPDQNEYYTKERTMRVTARSVDGTASSYGYGLVVHGSVQSGEAVGYGFLIYTGNDPSYAVFNLTGDQNKALVKWTRSSIIRTGTNTNQLEVRVKGDQLSFYVNGQYVTSITDSAGYGDGRVGFFTSNENPVAFDDLEIYK
ncbi:MAG TPA: hypothetical protein VM911_14800 [Pyrinomonadaceae bacterium]|jgi:hypothetical protein|nr:hypothetical protein [Pyrinomonadaceae bacterium]